MRRVPTITGRFAILALALIGLVVSGCDRSAQRETLHPKVAQIPGADSATVIGRDSLSHGDWDAERLAGWRLVRDALFGARTVVALGAAGISGSDAPDVFGRIADVAVDTSRAVAFVLDELAQEIRLFRLADGSFLGRIGGLGDGPSELRNAHGIEILGDGRVVAASRGLKMKVFAESSQGWQAQQHITTPFGSTGMCVLPYDRVFMSAYDQVSNTLIHEVLLTPTESQTSVLGLSFGSGYKDPDWLVQMEMGKGPIGCVPGARPVVVLGLRSAPIVRGFDPDSGSTLWSVRLSDFAPIPVLSGTDRQGNYVRRGEASRYDILGSLHDLPNGYLLLQVGRGWVEQQKLVIESYLLDGRHGTGGYIGQQLPRIIPNERGYVALFEDPYPRLEIREFDSDHVR